ncbi:MAG: VWA domain-containing protein [Luteolibacter sp.]
MTLAHPAWLLLLLLLPPLAVAAILASRRGRRQWDAWVSPRLRQALVKTGSPLPRWFALGSLALASALLIGALARLQGDAGVKTEQTIGRNVLIALDLSRSMRTQDVSPDRLGQAKVAIYEMLDSLPSDRIGLIGFAGSAHIYAPLTMDHNAVRETVEQIDETWAPFGGSDLSSAVKLAIETLKKTQQKNNALVILSDGEENTGKLDEMIRLASQSGVYITAIGIGTDNGGYIPSRDYPGEHQLDRGGHPILSRFHRETMQKLATETHGTFLMAGTSGDISTVVRNAVSRLDSFEQKGLQRRVFIEYFQWLLLPAICFLALSILLGTRWRALPVKASTPLIALAALLAATTPSRAEEKAIIVNRAEAAERALSEGKNKEAASLYRTLAEKALSEETASRYRLGLGIAGYRDADYRTAREAFSAALFSKENAVRSAAHFGLGNTQFQLGWKTLTDESYPTDPELIPDLDRFGTLVKEKLAELRQSPMPATGDTELFRTFNDIIINWTDAIRHYDSSRQEHPAIRTADVHVGSAQGAEKNRATTLAYLKRLRELLKEEQEQSEQAAQSAGPPQEGDGEGDGEGDQQGKGNKKGDNSSPGDKPPEQPEHHPEKEGETPEERARRLLKENSDTEKGPLTPGRRQFRAPEKDW